MTSHRGPSEEELLLRELQRERAARKRAEELLEQKVRELNERNQELHRKAQQLARSIEELEQFNYVASHDLQSPLRSISGFAQMLSKRVRDKLDPDSLDYLDFIETGAKRLHTLINDLLQFSRAGYLQLAPQRVSAEAVIADVCQRLRGILEGARAQVLYQGLPEVHADPVQLGQLFQNLVDNAVKFQPKADARPLVEIDAQREPGRWHFTVRDNGIGIATEHVDRIFGVFARLNNVEDYPGTGVGLPICKKIVERHGGQIWAVSQLGRGTTIHFTLPEPAPA